MRIEFAGPTPWPAITAAVRRRGPRRAAVAYIGHNAPRLLPLKRRDVLVVNASDAALRAHATSPEAIEAFLERGIRVLSLPTLHAKVIAMQSVAVIGSANASQNSQSVSEAAAITTDAKTVEAVHAFVDEIVRRSTDLDETFVHYARKVWNSSKGVDLPGASGKTPIEPGFLPAPLGRVFLCQTETYKPSEAESELERNSRRALRRSAGPAAMYSLDWLGHVEDGSYRRGDIVLLNHCMRDDPSAAELSPPAVVWSEGIRLPRAKRKAGYILRYREADNPIPTAEAQRRLTALGIYDPRLSTDRQIISSSLKNGLLDLWGLGSP